MRSFFHHAEDVVSGADTSSEHMPVRPYTRLAAINHRIRSCHGVSITFARRLPTFFDIWKAEPDNFCPAARREETQRTMIMVKESETHVCVALKIKSRTGVALKYRPEKEKVTKGMSRNSTLNLILYDASQKSGSHLEVCVITVILFEPGCQQLLQRHVVMRTQAKCFPLFPPAAGLLGESFPNAGLLASYSPSFILLSFESFPLQSLQRRF